MERFGELMEAFEPTKWKYVTWPNWVDVGFGVYGAFLLLRESERKPCVGSVGI